MARVRQIQNPLRSAPQQRSDGPIERPPPVHAPSHTHSHDPSHGPSHAHSQDPAHTNSHGHSQGSSHGPAHAHSPGPSHAHSHGSSHAPSHAHSHDPSDGPSHTYSHVNGLSHSPSRTRSHDTSHDPTLAHSQGPSHAHSHDPSDGPSHTHSHGLSHIHSHTHSHGPSHTHSHDTSHASSHADSHDHSHGPKPVHVAGRESQEYWVVEAIDLEDAIETIRVKVRGVDYLLPGQRIIVNFDGKAPYGEAQGVLAGYLGTLATDCNLFPISFPKWCGPKGMPKSYFEDCYEKIIKPKFWLKACEADAIHYCNASISKKWATHRHRLWSGVYNPASSRDELIRNVPIDIDKDQWASFVDYRLQPSTMAVCRRNKISRSKQKIPHTGGSKANSRRRHEMFLQTGQQVGRGQIYLETHKKKDGSFVNDEARAIGEKIELALTQGTEYESEISPYDAVGRVLGSERSGRVRCMGLGAIPSNTFRRNTRLRFSNIPDYHSSSSSTNWQEKYVQLESKVQAAMNALKAYMILKEGKIPEELAGFFGSES